MPTKCARKNKNKWFNDCLGLMNLRMSLCIPYPNTIKRTRTTKRVILCKCLFIFKYYLLSNAPILILLNFAMPIDY